MQIDHVLRQEQAPVQVMHLAELLSMTYADEADCTPEADAYLHQAAGQE
jgi:hypothetical protein